MIVDSQNHSQWLKEGESRPTEFFLPFLEKQVGLIPNHHIVICPSDHSPAPHVQIRQHPFPYLQFVVDGSLAFNKSPSLDQRSRVQLAPGDSVYSPPYGWDSTRGISERTLLNIANYPQFISVSLTHHASDAQRSFRYYCFSEIPNPSVSQVCQVIDRCIDKKNLTPIPYLLQSLLSLVCEVFSKNRKTRDGSFLWRIMLTWINEHASSPIDRKDVANIFNITEDHVSRIFRLHSEDSFHQTLEKVRMEKASWLIRDPQNKIKWIAQTCGYQNADSFSRAFKRFYGVSPRLRMNDE